jgi:hypothetical protein
MFATFSWLIEHVWVIKGPGNWSWLVTIDTENRCKTCAPELPLLKWKLGDKNGRHSKMHNQMRHSNALLKNRTATFSEMDDQLRG